LHATPDHVLALATGRPAVRWFFEYVRQAGPLALAIEEIALDASRVPQHRDRIARAGVAVVDTGNDPVQAIGLCRALRSERPDLPIIALVCCTQPFTPWHLRDLLRLEGGCSLLDTEATVDELLRTVERLQQGRTSMHLDWGAGDFGGLRNGLAEGASSASGPAGLDHARNLSLIELVAEGLSDREIGARLHLSPHTIHHQIERLRGELGVRNRVELAAWAGRNGLYTRHASG
jgi:DNA-binding NarL/FixJ family response regulator